MSGMAVVDGDGGRAALRVEDAVNDTCPWSGKPISADSLTLYRGFTVGFCNTGCRDKFETATRHFEAALAAYEPDDDSDGQVGFPGLPGSEPQAG
jgi:hypothetical protein